MLVSYSPSKGWIYLLLGLVPLLTWMPTSWGQLDAAKPPQALVAGLIVTGMNLLAGGAGPLLDIFFVRTALTRHQIVATKALTQTFSHVAKIAFYGAPLLAMTGATGLPPPWFFAVMAPLSMAGGWLGGLILDRLSDVGFKSLTRWLLTAIGTTYLITAIRIFSSA